ncbi:MAG TPA: hypothetical protein VFK02_31640 [Kofleriaceae bacterium]|nr:hypothetical protein [Kofleriaceae bacterium]
MSRPVRPTCLPWTVTLVLAASGCGGCGGDDPPGPLIYSDPPDGALRLVKAKGSTSRQLKLDLVVGEAPLTGYSVGFDLPIDASKVTLGAFTPGTALDPGTAPVAATAALPAQGPLAGMLVIGQSQKASGAGAIASDTTLPPRTVLCSIELDLVEPPAAGVVFDGTANGFLLPSGGLRDKVGQTVVDASQVKIGKLEVRP